jgi:hypothetical protein
MQTKGIDNLFYTIITENFPNLKKERITQVWQVYRTPNHQVQKINSPRHIIIKTLSTKGKKRILKAPREKTSNI